MTQDSTQLLQKIELLDFNLISGPNDSRRVTQNSQTTIDLAFTSFPCTSTIIEHAITDRYGVEVDFNIGRIKNYEKEDFYGRNHGKLQKQEFRFEFNWFLHKKLIEVEFEDSAIGADEKLISCNSKFTILWMQCCRCQKERQNRKSWITNDIKNASVKKHKLLKAYQNQGTLEAKQKLRQQTVKVKKNGSRKEKRFLHWPIL